MKKIRVVLIIIVLIIAAIFFAANSLSGFSNKKIQEIVCLGDSLTYGYGSTVSYPEVLEELIDAEVINAGVSGRNSQTLLNNFNEYISNDTDLVILFIGANDIFHNENLDTKSNIEKIIIELQNKNIEVKICNYPYTKIEKYFTKLDEDGINKYHSLILDLNKDIKDLSEKYHVELLDLEKYFNNLLDNGTYEYDEIYSDGVHYNELGYRLMAEFISKKL